MSEPKDSNKNADLSVFTVADLRERSKHTQDALFKACQTSGFFYLDFKDSEVERVEELYSVMTDLFNRPLEEKLEYQVKDHGGPELMDGYRETGLSTGPYAGKRDGFESYMIPRNAFLPKGDKWEAPATLIQHKDIFKTSMSELHHVAVDVLTLLSAALGIEGDATLQNWHRWEELSTTVLGVLQYLPASHKGDKVGHFAHTDAGTLSFVFSRIGGLQICPPETDEWQFVKPREKMAIVNVGDSLTFLTGQRLPSIMHRVIPYPAEEGSKQTIAYFLRPEFETPMTDREGKMWKSRAWHQNKCRILRASREEQSKSSILTGRNGYLGLASATTTGATSVSELQV